MGQTVLFVRLVIIQKDNKQIMETYEAYINSPIGTIHLQETDGFLVAANFMNEEKATSASFPTKLLADTATQFQNYFEGNIRSFSILPRSQQSGTPFQQSVWKEFCNIPFGKTVSYLQMAKNLGDEKCIRAAGTANGKNNLVIIVPCHRVIGSNGSLVGFAGGLWRKQWLLEHEAKLANGLQLLF